MPADVVTDQLLATVTWEWQDVEQIMDELIPKVAPGRAKRQYLARSKPETHKGVKTPLTESEQIASGARTIINDRIAGQVDGGRVERRVLDDGTRQIRFRERREVADNRGNCPACNRPFPEAATVKFPLSKPRAKSKVVYPKFPQWERQDPSETSNG